VTPLQPYIQPVEDAHSTIPTDDPLAKAVFQRFQLAISLNFTPTESLKPQKYPLPVRNILRKILRKILRYISMLYFLKKLDSKGTAASDARPRHV
jgi:hypothetical protein